MDIKIIKQDGTLQLYFADKIERVTQAAGLKPQEAKALAANITVWIKSLNTNKVSSLKIRDKVSEELTKINRFAKEAYDWYEKTKEI